METIEEEAVVPLLGQISPDRRKLVISGLMFIAFCKCFFIIFRNYAASNSSQRFKRGRSLYAGHGAVLRFQHGFHSDRRDAVPPIPRKNAPFGM